MGRPGREDLRAPGALLYSTVILSLRFQVGPPQAWFFSQAPKNDGSNSGLHGATKVAPNTSTLKPAVGDQATPSEGQQGESS